MPANEPNRPWRAWYSEKAWFRVRWQAIQRDSVVVNGKPVPRCRQTGVLLVGPRHAPNSPVVDHIRPHKGDRSLFLDLNNLQTVSKAWHDSVKRSIELSRKAPIGVDGFPIGPSDRERRAARDLIFRPVNLRPSKPRLVIVCGPPAAGKSTYISQRMAEGDVLVDADLEARRLGIGFERTDAEWIRILQARNLKLKMLAYSPAPAAWYAATAARASERHELVNQLHPAEVVIVRTPPDVCVRRIIETRPLACQAAMRKAVYRWHDEYEPRDGETVLTSV